MKRILLICRQQCYDAASNLAGEKWLMDNLERDCDVLYLWQNANCIVIGRNQNVWNEVNVGAAMERGSSIVRRLSGGGSVYHDLGNVNFTFITSIDRFDIPAQTSIILEAVRSLGIEAEQTGRNDLCTLGRKFSGHSYHISGSAAFHNGTILLNADAGIMGEVLSPERSKLNSKGVESVRSRTINLCELKPDLNVEKVFDALERSFSKHYATTGYTTINQDSHFNELLKRFSSRDWIFNRQRESSTALKSRFTWGCVEIYPEWEDGRIRDCAVYTDALQDDAAVRIREALIGLTRKETEKLSENKTLKSLFQA